MYFEVKFNKLSSYFHISLLQSKYDRWAIVTKSVQQDLSCQLMSTLWQYLKGTNWRHIERLINVDNLPGVSVLEQGVHTLVRQWKVNLSLINPEMATAATYWRTDQPKQLQSPVSDVATSANQDEDWKHMPEVRENRLYVTCSNKTRNNSHGTILRYRSLKFQRQKYC